MRSPAISRAASTRERTPFPGWRSSAGCSPTRGSCARFATRSVFPRRTSCSRGDMPILGRWGPRCCPRRSGRRRRGRGGRPFSFPRSCPRRGRGRSPPGPHFPPETSSSCGTGGGGVPPRETARHPSPGGVGGSGGAAPPRDETPPHKPGSSFISRRFFGQSVDTIFEIGGQDSKFISLEDGVVVDFAMNDACAAGTGSFLEEQAERLGVRIQGEFAEMALSSRAPVRMGERCTVFMEQDLNTYLHRGASKVDLVAGLAYSVVINYLNRVVRGRRIGETIYFQGGTAYNDAVAAAFTHVLGKPIIVPPHNGGIGAIQHGLPARDKVRATAESTRFRGFDLGMVDYRRREVICKGVR